MLKVGLTGGIGSGKSTVAELFELLGVPVYYSDTRARELIHTDETVRKAIVGLLGPKSYDASGAPDRKFIARQVFGNQTLLHQLNQIVHPAVREDFAEWCTLNGGAPYILQEAAILFESGGAALLDAVILVWAPEQTRVSRVMRRDGSSEQEVLARMQHQMPDARKVELSQYWINNDGDHFLTRQVADIHAALGYQSTHTAEPNT